MTTWVRALCTQSVRALTPEMLRKGIADRLPTLGAYYGEEGDRDTVTHLAVEPQPGATSGTTEWHLRYQADAARFLRVQRLADPEAVAQAVRKLRDGLEGVDEDGVEDVRALLDDVVEAVCLELPMADVEGIGWVVAIAAAACFAEHGAGLIQADGEGWMAPEGHTVTEVLDGD